MVVAAVKFLDSSRGVSLPAIKEFIVDTFDVGGANPSTLSRIFKGLTDALKSGAVRRRGSSRDLRKGSRQRFTIPPPAKPVAEVPTTPVQTSVQSDRRMPSRLAKVGEKTPVGRNLPKKRGKACISDEPDRQEIGDDPVPRRIQPARMCKV